MTKPVLLGIRGAWCLLASWVLLLSPNLYAQEGAVIEEIVVTGSYIKRDSFDSASPITILTAETIEANATTNLGEVLAAQTFNYGSDTQTNTYSARFQLGNVSQSNLRGLGSGATLDLIDGKRTNNPFLSNAMPQIAIARIDILKDAASATYGTDAVAGVVNLIPRKDYSGVTTSLFYTTDEGGDYDETAFEILMGSETVNGHFTMAARYSTREELKQVDRPEYIRDGFDRSGTGNPGDWLVPVRDATGAMVDQSPLAPGLQGAKMVDPGCGVFNGPGGADAGLSARRPQGRSDEGGATSRNPRSTAVASSQDRRSAR